MSYHDPRYDFRILKQQVKIDQVFDAYGMNRTLKRRGHQLYGPCPLHKGDNPTAFRVHLSRNAWHCFSYCGGGDVVELVRRIEDCGYAEAARHLRRLADYNPSRLSPDNSAESSRCTQPTFHRFTRRIPLDPKVPFLQDDKGISVDTARRFEAGWTCASSFLRDTVAVRLRDLEGRPIGYCGRRLDPADISRWGKWRFPRGFPKAKTLFNSHRALTFRETGIVVVECPWAVLRLAQAGIRAAVALLGSRMSSVQEQWLANAPELLCLLDGDEAGRKGARDIEDRLGMKVRVIVHELPDGAEPEDLTDAQLRTIVRCFHPFSLNPCSFGYEVLENAT